MKKIDKDAAYKAAIDALNSGLYVTIISYVRAISGADYVKGMTYKDCIFVREYK